ncbi:MAG: recombinase family protein [Sphingomonadales bacterium]|nr:recombinase family protein [Sphingomonadales bacterium]
MKRCFGYVRVSTVKQGDGVSLEAQREAILAFASRNNIEITQWFEEKETAAKRGGHCSIKWSRPASRQGPWSRHPQG